MVYSVYTDGSYQNGYWGAGAVIINNWHIEKEITTGGEDTDGIRNVAGEINAVLETLNYLYEKCADKKRGEVKVVINHDYEGLQKWADGEWRTNKPATIAYKQSVEKAREFFDITFVKVKAHSGDRYNELADDLAKAGVIIAVNKQKKDDEDKPFSIAAAVKAAKEPEIKKEAASVPAREQLSVPAREQLVDIISDYFDIGDSYAYHLTRDKSAFQVGTVDVDDFEEFDRGTAEDLADYIIKKLRECAG